MENSLTYFVDTLDSVCYNVKKRKAATFTMVINDMEEYKKVWDRVYSELGFRPSYDYHGHSMNVPLPFAIKLRYAVYAIDDMTEEHMDKLSDIMPSLLSKLTPEGERVYALDWHHSAFLFEPRNEDEMKSVPVIDDKTGDCIGSEYFPGFCPDGDYYFFIAEDFSFGWLGHPWRQEIWVFGDKLVDCVEKVYKELGMEKLIEKEGA